MGIDETRNRVVTTQRIRLKTEAERNSDSEDTLDEHVWMRIKKSSVRY